MQNARFETLPSNGTNVERLDDGGSVLASMAFKVIAVAVGASVCVMACAFWACRTSMRPNRRAPKIGQPELGLASVTHPHDCANDEKITRIDEVI